MKQAHIIEMHAPSMSVKIDQGVMVLRKAGWREDLLEKLKAEYPAVIQGPTFEGGAGIVLVARGASGEMPRRGPPKLETPNRTALPVGHVPLEDFLRGDWTAGQAERHALRGWMELEKFSIIRSLHDQIRNQAKVPAPANGPRPTVADELKQFGAWMTLMDLRGAEFDFIIGEGGDHRVTAGARNPDITALNERTARILPALLLGAGLPCRPGMTGDLSIFDSGQICVTGTHPDTGWRHARIAGGTLATPLRDIRSPCEPRPVPAIRALRDKIGDVDQEVTITARVEDGALVGRPEIAFANMAGLWGEEMTEDQATYLRVRLDAMVPDILRAGWAAALREDHDPDQMAEDFPSYLSRSFSMELQVDEKNMYVEVVLENEAGSKRDLSAYVMDNDIDEAPLEFVVPEVDEDMPTP